MIQFGRSLRWYNDYNQEVEFSKKHGFDFMQVWFKNGDILIDNITGSKEKIIIDSEYPIILHALFEIQRPKTEVNDFTKYTQQLLNILCNLEHKEVIIHPVCSPELLTADTILALDESIVKTNEIFNKQGITLYIENNSVINPLNYSSEDLNFIFSRNPSVEFLLDVAHIDNYNHLEKMLSIRFPKCLHIADKHFGIGHEHLPINDGELDFELIFSKYLSKFEGKIIFEVVTDNDTKIINGKNYIQKLLNV